MIKRVEIFDRDGVLACSMHRTSIDEQGLLDLGHWLANNTPEQVAKDEILPTAEYYRECVADPEVYTVICTVVQMQDYHIEFLRDNIGLPDKLIYPAHNIKNGGAAFKAAALSKYATLKQFADLPKHFHEDNMEYLGKVCDALPGFTGHYYPSGYGVAGVKNIPAGL